MATLNIWQRVEVDMGDHVFAAGSVVTPRQITVTSDHVQRVGVADAATAKVFDVADDLADFDALVILSDQTIEAEFVVANGSGAEVVYVNEILANVPFILSSDASRQSDHTEDWGADGTADTIDKVTVKNSSGTTANVLSGAFTA